MDTRVKERLVGAAVLVGIIVALVPEMLSGPRDDIPAPASGDDQVRTYTIDLSREPGASGPPREVIPGDAPVVTPAPPPENAAPEDTPAESPDTVSSGSAPAFPAEKPSTQASRAEPPTQAPQVAEPPAVESGWAVQLGSFARRDNAERLAKDLRQRGYRAFVSHVGAGDSARHRVRVGPEQDRTKAEALAQRLRREGRQVSIVAHP
jgi:DedD protein